MNITNPTNFGVPGLTLTTSNAEGTGNAVRTGASIALFDAEVPDAITFGQSGAAGSASVSSRRDHAHAMASETTLRVGGQTSVSSTTSTSVADLISIGSLSIGVNDPIKFVLTTSKSTGASSAAAFGLKLNTTVCVLAVAGAASLIAHSGTNQNEIGYGVYEVAPRINNYQMMVGYQIVTDASKNGVSKTLGPINDLAGFPPVATITDFVITAISTSSVTATCGLLQIYGFASA